MDQSGSYEQIMKRIIFGLTGDNSKDIPYLKELEKSFENHPLQKEITEGIGTLVNNILPMYKGDDMDGLRRKSKTDIVLEETESLVNKKEYDKALAVFEKHCAVIKDVYESDSKNVYYCFTNILEETLYEQLNKTSQKFRDLLEDLPSFYLVYGNLLFKLKRYSEARAIYKKGLQYNPVSTALLFSYAETLKVTSEFDEFLKITADALSLAYMKQDIARAYRNYGYYNSEIERFDTAMSFYFVSLLFEKSEDAKREMNYIIQKTGIKPDFSNPGKFIITMKKEKVQCGASTFVIGVLETLVKYSVESNMYGLAREMLMVLYNLTDEKKYLDLVNDLHSKKGESA
ncbi:MAG: hypothetical protein Q4G69_09610 [Planctomycetia bacterium]|nr:hypothetical protein [Planctomycetia bacterium]